MKLFKYVFLLCSLRAFGQIDSLKSLPIFEITDSAFVPLQDAFNQELHLNKASKLNQNLAQLLQNETGVFMKSYGPGQLTTPTFRGGDANQTVVLFNGTKINAANLGSTDFTLIPANNFSSFNLFGSSSSNVFASGGIGGGINIQSTATIDSSDYQLHIGTGSFGQNQISFSINQPISFGKIKTAIFFSNSILEAKNDFSYKDIFNEPYSEKVRLFNTFSAKNRQVNLLVHLKKTELRINSWLTNASRELPQPINLKETYSQFQNDYSYRLQALLKHHFNAKHQLELMVFNEQNENEYIDNISGIDNQNKFESYQGFVKWNWNVSKALRFTNQVYSSYNTATSDNYNQQESQIENSTLHRLSYSLSHSRFSGDLGTRTVLNNNRFEVLPFFSLGYLANKKNEIKVFLNLSRSARFPTLNELYWNPGGNLNLKPETSVNAEIGFKTKPEHRFYYQVAAYASSLKNRIRWLPNGVSFSPVNIAESKTYGLDANLRYALIQSKKQKLNLRFNGSLNRSVGCLNSENEWFALSHIPFAKISASLEYEKRRFAGALSHQYISKRFITSDESAYMPSFAITNVSMAYRFKWLVLSMNINNLLNIDYQNLPWRPMPGRAFYLNLSLKL